MNPVRLVFIDETWATTNMARRYGRAPRGERVIASVPHGHWKTSTFVAGLRDDAITAPLVIDGAMNGETFRAYIEPHRRWPTAISSSWTIYRATKSPGSAKRSRRAAQL